MTTAFARPAARRFRSAVGLSAVLAACLGVGGCNNTPGNTSSSSDAGANGTIAEQRTQYIDTMLSNARGTGPMTQRGIMRVITGYGGGYATDAKISGAPGTSSEQLTLEIVVGAGPVQDTMQGESDMNPETPSCFTLTVDFYSSAKSSEHSCPSSLSTEKAKATALRQINAQLATDYYTSPPLHQAPTSLAQAESDIGLSGHGANGAAPADSSFATGKSPDGSPAAGLAMPQSNGSCIYVVYRTVKATSKNGTTFSVSDSPAAYSWVAPVDDPCTGTAATAAGAFLTVDSYAGG